MRALNKIWLFILCLVLLSCNLTKNLPENETLYKGSKFEIVKAQDSMNLDIKDTKEELATLIRKKPNANILGYPYKLGIYNLMGEPKGKGLSYWIKNKIGEPPVLGSSIDINKNVAIIENRLENRGFFGSTATVDTTKKNKELHIVYKALVQPPYKIRNLEFRFDTLSAIGKNIHELSRASFLQKGARYDLDIIKSERVRIDAGLKEKGLYFFNPDFIIADVDTAVGGHQVDMFLRLKKETPPKAKQEYRLNDIYVFADYTADTDTSMQVVKQQSRISGGYHIYDPQRKVRTSVFKRALVFKQGDLYSREMHNQSLKRLVNLGMYKFVKARFQETDTTQQPSLNAFYYLTPAPIKSLRAEVSGLTKSNNSAGTEISLTWRHRNLLRGAEQFSAKIYGGSEKQVYSQQPTISTNRFGVEFNLISPRLIGPFKFKSKGDFTPQTKLTLGYEFFERNTQYTMNSAKLNFGYIWKRDITQEHRLDIASLNLVQPTYINPDYQLMLDTNITLARSIEKQFIVGPNYNYNYNSLIVANNRPNNYFINWNIDLSGVVMGAITGADITNGKQRNFLGIPFSQYIKTEAEFRHYLKLGKRNTIASRILGGIGYAYGNSTNLPFVKAFFAGGTNDIRAFRARSLGPGSYYAGNAATSTVSLPDQPGDLKLELNSEWRFKLLSVLYGALFVDAGNIWTIRNDVNRPGSQFTSSFLKQFAVGVGTGIRIDVSYFVVRLDFSIPVRKPFLPEGNRWVFNQIAFGDSQWVKENLIYNLAIGYPF
jgi:outer membrane protein assembly factor BamA